MSLKEQGSLVNEEVGAGWTFIMHEAYSFQPKTIIFSQTLPRLVPQWNQLASVTTSKTSWKRFFCRQMPKGEQQKVVIWRPGSDNRLDLHSVPIAARLFSAIPEIQYPQPTFSNSVLLRNRSYLSTQFSAKIGTFFFFFLFFKPHRFFWFVCLFVTNRQGSVREKGDVIRSRAPVEIQQHLNANAVTLVGLFASAGSSGTHTVPTKRPRILVVNF